MSDTPNFAKLVPGFDFLQGLVKNAGSALPSIGQWVAPTLNPEELQKRIDELKTVQFWLEQNAKMLGTTIQALEVQKMTLSTLKTMNVQMADLRDAMKVPPAAASLADGFGADALMQAAKTAMGGLAGAGKAAAEPVPETPPAPAPKPRAAPRPEKAEAAPAGVVDPMQWWGALTKQFTQLAASALKDSAADAARNFAGAMAKAGPDAAPPPAKAPSAAAPAKKTAAAKKAPAARPASRKTPARAAKPRAS